MFRRFRAVLVGCVLATIAAGVAIAATCHDGCPETLRAEACLGACGVGRNCWWYSKTHCTRSDYKWVRVPLAGYDPKCEAVSDTIDLWAGTCAEICDGAAVADTRELAPDVPMNATFVGPRTRQLCWLGT